MFLADLLDESIKIMEQKRSEEMHREFDRAFPKKKSNKGANRNRS